jgi:signal peptidase I
MWRYLLGLTGSAMVGVILARRRFAVVTVEGASMLPTLAAGDRVLVRRARLGQLRVGQVVVAEAPDWDRDWSTSLASPAARREWLIKRVAAVPGDPRPTACLPETTGPVEGCVPKGRFVVLGDNAVVSYDSRQMGYFTGDRLLGIVVRRMSAGQ